MRLIDADAFKDWVDNRLGCCDGVDLRKVVGAWIDEQPTIEAKSARPGRWIETPLFCCSNCGSAQDEETDYCPSCGAKMGV